MTQPIALKLSQIFLILSIIWRMKTPFEFEDMGTSGSAAMSVFQSTEFSENGCFSWGC